MLIEQRPARWWNLLNSAIPWNFYPLVKTHRKSGGTWLARMLAEPRYETMMADTGADSFRIRLGMGGNRNMEECRALAERFSFERQADRRPGLADNSSFLRKVVGPWACEPGRGACMSVKFVPDGNPPAIARQRLASSHNGAKFNLMRLAAVA